jgi:hypothetical protein
VVAVAATTETVTLVVAVVDITDINHILFITKFNKVVSKETALFFCSKIKIIFFNTLFFFL